MLDRKLLAVEIPAFVQHERALASEDKIRNVHAGHLNLISGNVTIRVLVEDGEGCVGIIGRWEEPGDIFNNEIFRSRPDKRVE